MNPGDDSFLRDLIQIFLEDSPQRIAEIELSLAAGRRPAADPGRAQPQGQLRQLRRRPSAPSARRSNSSAAAAVLGRGAGPLPELKIEFNRVKAALRRWFRRS